MRTMWVCLAAAALAGAQEPASVFQNVCGKCHPPEAVVTAAFPGGMAGDDQ